MFIPLILRGKVSGSGDEITHKVREGGAISSAGQCRIMLAKKISHGVSGELRITSALSILGGHKMALGCSGLHANGCFNACRNCPAPKNLCRNSPALPYRPIPSIICTITNCTVYVRKKFQNSKCHAHWTARWSSLVVHLDVKIAREGLIQSFLSFQATQSKG